MPRPRPWRRLRAACRPRRRRRPFRPPPRQGTRHSPRHSRAPPPCPNAPSRGRFEVRHPGEGMPFARAAPRWPRRADARSPVRGGDQAEELVLREARPLPTTRRHLRAAEGQGAGLVDHQRVDPLQPLQCLGVADEHALLCAPSDPHHDRHRRCEPQRAGAGDDQHRDGGDQREGEPRFGAERHHTAKAATATAITAGTNHAATRSASPWIGARLRCAARPSGRCGPASCRRRRGRPA